MEVRIGLPKRAGICVLIAAVLLLVHHYYLNRIIYFDKILMVDSYEELVKAFPEDSPLLFISPDFGNDKSRSYALRMNSMKRDATPIGYEMGFHGQDYDLGITAVYESDVDQLRSYDEIINYQGVRVGRYTYEHNTLWFSGSIVILDEICYQIEGSAAKQQGVQSDNVISYNWIDDQVVNLHQAVIDTWLQRHR